jgi:hypothetical protein
LADEKEIAEHLMLIDLGRNDLGRIAKIGSVKLTYIENPFWLLKTFSLHYSPKHSSEPSQ